MRANRPADQLTQEASEGFFLPAYEEHFAHMWDEADGLITILTIIGAALAIWQFIVLISQFRKGQPAMRIVLPLIGGLLFASAMILPHVMIPFYLSIIDGVIGAFVSLLSGAFN